MDIPVGKMLAKMASFFPPFLLALKKKRKKKLVTFDYIDWFMAYYNPSGPA